MGLAAASGFHDVSEGRQTQTREFEWKIRKSAGARPRWLPDADFPSWLAKLRFCAFLPTLSGHAPATPDFVPIDPASLPAVAASQSVLVASVPAKSTPSAENTTPSFEPAIPEEMLDYVTRLLSHDQMAIIPTEVVEFSPAFSAYCSRVLASSDLESGNFHLAVELSLPGAHLAGIVRRLATLVKPTAGFLLSLPPNPHRGAVTEQEDLSVGLPVALPREVRDEYVGIIPISSEVRLLVHHGSEPFMVSATPGHLYLVPLSAELDVSLLPAESKSSAILLGLSRKLASSPVPEETPKPTTTETQAAASSTDTAETPVARFLTEIGLPQYSARLHAEGFELVEDLFELDDAGLLAAGIDLLGHRTRIIRMGRRSGAPAPTRP
jgi:hypothetical protein